MKVNGRSWSTFSNRSSKIGQQAGTTGAFTKAVERCKMAGSGRLLVEADHISRGIAKPRGDLRRVRADGLHDLSAVRDVKGGGAIAALGMFQPKTRL
jgi:hypothetical protein